MKVGFPLMKYVLTTLTKSALVPLEVTAIALATYAAIQKKVMGWTQQHW